MRYLVLASLFLTFLAAGCNSDSSSNLSAENGRIALPLAEISDGKAHHFEHTVDGKTIRFFVLQSRDGVYRAAFDACDVCFRERKGYSQAGEFMICNNCGQKFHSSRINVLKGGCNPAPLERAVQGEYLVLNETDIARGSWYF